MTAISNPLAIYKRGDGPLPAHNRLWPLYGAGFENLGRDGMAIDVPMPSYGPDELLVRHDACGICFSDIKVIRAGQNHPRIYRDMRTEPVVLGHEVALTVVGVGENLTAGYAVGDRFIVQADIYVDGVGYAYGYEIQGGFSRYNVIDQRVLNGDGGNYLLPIKETTGYAEAALNEPWACVEASYHVQYRTRWKTGGRLWLVGDGAGIELGQAVQWRPAQIVLDVEDAEFAQQVRTWADEHGIAVYPGINAGASSASNGGDENGQEAGERFDDIVVLSRDPDLIEAAFARLANGGVFAVVTGAMLSRRVRLDIGRLHYDNLSLVGTAQPDLSTAYGPIRTQLKTGGSCWMLGAGGPMGHMHLQRALELEDRPRQIVATNLHGPRIDAVSEKFGMQAHQDGVELICLSQADFGSAEALVEQLRTVIPVSGFDDIVVMAPSAAAAETAMDLLAKGGVMNIFAGLPRGTMAAFDLYAVTHRQVRFTGISGSSIGDLRHMLDLTESHTLSPNHAVAAVAGLEGVAAGLRAVADGRFPGKVVIYPNLSCPLPLTTLEELETCLPQVHALLDEHGNWTNEAEAALLAACL